MYLAQTDQEVIKDRNAEKQLEKNRLRIDRVAYRVVDGVILLFNYRLEDVFH